MRLRNTVLHPDRLLTTLQHQTRIVIHITMRDRAKRLAATAMIFGVCWYSGARESIVAISIAILLSEIIIEFCYRAAPERETDFGWGLIGTVWVTNSLSTVAYLLPAVILAHQPSVALLLGGFMWVFGVFVHISNTFVSLPLYNWSQMIPGFITATGVIWVSSQYGHSAKTMSEWMVVAAMMVVYASNTFETMNKQKDTQHALSRARSEANARLRALEYMNRHDALTGLLDRHAFDEELARILAAREDGTHVGVFLLDLDGFKPINDTYSHEAGDKVLVTIAERLTQLTGIGGVAARLGGDEFAIAMPMLSSDRAAMRLAQQIAAAVEQPITYNERALRVAASIGIGLTGVSDDNVAGLCAGADQAMYRAKGETGRRVILYDPQTFAPRLSLDDRQRIVEAFLRGEIRPFYQPKVRLDCGAVCGFEALSRWVHPERGLLMPSDFLYQINELGLQGDFVTHVARQVLSDIDTLLDAGLSPGEVSINIPEVTLATQSGRHDLDVLLAAHPAAARHITFEITEDVFIARAGDMMQLSIAHFRRAGVRISLDDFGTGFASFQHLRQLEFDEIKIDTSFVAGLGHDRSAEVLVEGLLNIARGLGVQVIAEGVETEAQRRHLLTLGCDFAQGYMFGRALPFDEVEVLLFAEAARAPQPPLVLGHGGA